MNRHQSCDRTQNISDHIAGMDDYYSHGWKAMLAYGKDFGSQKMLGHNAGAQLTISKSGMLF